MLILNQFSGEIDLRKRRIQIQKIKLILRKYYKIVVTVETDNELKCILIRRYRYIGIPWIGPHSRIEVKLVREENSFKLQYNFFWPEYILFFIISVIIGVIEIKRLEPEYILIAMVNMSLAMFIFSVLLYIDTFFFSKKIHKLFSNI